MEWREQSTLGCDAAFEEAQRWLEEVTKKKFGDLDFRSALENGVLLCDLINRIKPGLIKRVNRLSTPIAGLDNVNVFLKACGKLGLKEAQLFHPGDLQDLSTRVTVKQEETSRRLKNVLITIYWLGRKAQVEPFYNGPNLNLRAFEGLLGIALSKVLEESAGQKGSVRDSGFGDSWYTEREELFSLPSGHRREDSLDSLDSVDCKLLSTSSEATPKSSFEGCGSDLEPDLGFRMADSKDPLQYRRSLVIEPRTAIQFNQFLPSKDKQVAYFPAPLRKKRAERHEENRRSWASPMYTEEDGTFTSQVTSSLGPAHRNGYTLASPSDWVYESDSDADRPEPDVVLDDLASRRFRSPSPMIPPNFAIPMRPQLSRTTSLPFNAPNAPLKTLAYFSAASPSPPAGATRTPVSDIPSSELYYDSEDEEEMGYADPVQDDLYARKLGWPLQPSAKEPFNKFLPKFWTPEEEARVKKIQLGSQCRPWYRKMQGFSKMSGSSSEDSDSEVSPWRAVIPTTWPQSSTPPSHPHTLGSPAHPHLHHVTAQSSHTQSHTVEQPHASFTAPLETGSPVLDPSAGPRLVKCTRAPTCGSSYPPEPYDAMGDDLPDLENDDMFTRRTHNFHRGVGLASLKSSSKMSVGALSWTEAAIVTQPRRGEPVTPDIERDDLVFRKLSHQKAECPLSGTPDIYHAVPMPEPHTLPSKLQARLLCMPCPPESEDELQRGQEQQVPTKADDMLLRRLAAGNLAGAGRPSSANQTPVMPSSCSDKDLNKWQALREASRLRYKKKLLVERLLQKRSGSIGSKSVSDIPEEPMVQRQVRYEDLQKIRAQVKECEDKWQEDLTKWKNRRRSINSDIVKKKEEREQMEQFAGGRGARALGGFGQVQEERESKEQFASSTDVCALSSDLEIKPSARNLPDQSCPNIPPETLSQRVYSSLPHGPPNLPVSTRDSRSQGSPSGIDPTQPALADQTGTSKEASQGSSVRASQEQRCYSTRVDERHSGPLYPSLSMDAKPGTARVSVSLPRSYQRSDSSRLTSVVTPRPFGSQSTKISSLPRTFVVDDSHKRFNGEMETHRSSVPNRYSQFVTSEDEDRSQTSSMQSSNEDEDEEEDQRASSFVPQTSRDVIQPKSVSKMNSNGDTEQEHYSDMRVSLSQKANGSQDFGFQTSWDSTGAHVKYIQRGSPAELCQLQVGDEILAVGGKLVSKMSYEEWKGSLDDALQQGSLVLDVRRHGKNNWAQDQPSLPYKSHKTINLTSMDPTLVGAPGNCINSSVELTSIAPTETAVKTVANCEVSSQAVSDLASKGINGGFHEEPVTMRNKEYEPISLRNLKRRSEFFEQPGSSESAFSSLVYLCGGSESAISDMPVPSLNAASSRWSWDPEEERRRQEKWQKEQERLLQEKYKRDQERLEEAWRCAQLEAMKIDTKHNQEQGGFEKVGSRSTVGLSSPPGPPSLHAAPLLEEEQQQEVARRERQEEDEHEAVRLQEEERHEQQRGQNDDGWRKMQDADEEKHKENEMLLEQQWSGASYGFTKALPEISMSDRAKSKSTSELDVDKPGAKVTSGSLIETPWSRDSRRKKSQHLSQAELERQQILQEMKKTTQLLTDSSWIRQRSTSVHKEPANLVGPIRRGESLDNLDSARPWRPLSWISGPANYNRPQSAFSASSLGYTCSGASTLPTSLSTGSLRQSPWFQSSASSSSPPGGTSEESVSKNHPPSQRSRSVSGRKMCTLCDLPLGKGAAMIIESLGLCYHLSCFKCVICQSDLGGSESGAEVRIRNGQLYCNDCYVKFKAGQPTTM